MAASTVRPISRKSFYAVILTTLASVVVIYFWISPSRQAVNATTATPSNPKADILRNQIKNHHYGDLVRMNNGTVYAIVDDASAHQYNDSVDTVHCLNCRMDEVFTFDELAARDAKFLPQNPMDGDYTGALEQFANQRGYELDK
jgi:hypothetical protein